MLCPDAASGSAEDAAHLLPIDRARSGAELVLQLAAVNARSHSLIHPRFGSKRRVNHPGEWVVGVMTAHPSWSRSEYDQSWAGLSARLRGTGAEVVTRRGQESCGPAGAVKES